LCLNAKAYDHVAPLAGSLNAPLKTCYVETPSDLQDLVEGAVAHLGQLEFSMHPIAREPLEKPHGDAVNSSLAGYARAKEVSSKSFAPLVQPRLPHLAQVGSLVTMSYQDTVEAVPYYGLMESILTWAASNIKDFDALMSHAHAKSPLEVIERSTQPYPAL
jgi:enoyl-[acyl-carrier protein] reductase I